MRLLSAHISYCTYFLWRRKKIAKKGRFWSNAPRPKGSPALISFGALKLHGADFRPLMQYYGASFLPISFLFFIDLHQACLRAKKAPSWARLQRLIGLA
jgi:hypothetical protein